MTLSAYPQLPKSHQILLMFLAALSQNPWRCSPISILVCPMISSCLQVVGVPLFLFDKSNMLLPTPQLVSSCLTTRTFASNPDTFLWLQGEYSNCSYVLLRELAFSFQSCLAHISFLYISTFHHCPN